MTNSLVQLDRGVFALASLVEQVEALDPTRLSVRLSNGDEVEVAAPAGDSLARAMRVVGGVNEVLQDRIAVSAKLHRILNGRYLTGADTMMTMKDTDKIEYVVEFDDKLGFATTDAGASIVWTSSDPTVLVPTPSADGLSCTFNLATPPKLGAVQVVMTAKKDGAADIVAMDDVTVVSGDAVSAKIVGTVSPA